MNFVFNIEPRNLAPTLLFARGTHTYAQIADPGTPRHGTEVEATRDFGPEIWTNLNLDMVTRIQTRLSPREINTMDRACVPCNLLHT